MEAVRRRDLRFTEIELVNIICVEQKECSFSFHEGTLLKKIEKMLGILTI